VRHSLERWGGFVVTVFLQSTAGGFVV